MTEYNYVGKDVPRTREQDKLSGTSLYAADFRLPGMLWGKILHSTCTHARIAAVDIARAQRLPGGKAVITSADTPGLRMGRWLQDRPVLAQEEVRYAGEPVAAVAAVDQETAAEALDLIHVDYEGLPSVFDPLEAMQPDAPLVHRHRDSYKPNRYRGSGQGNIILEGIIRQGDVERGLAESDFIHRGRYSTQAVHPGYIEPHAVLAAIDGQGKVTLWSSTKGPFAVRSMTAKFLKIPMSKIRVIAPALGGDFGGKGTAYLEPIALLLALKSGFPVKLILSQHEELTSTFVRDAAFMELTLGAKKDGTLLALKGQIVSTLASSSLISRKGPIIGVGERRREEMLADQAKADHEVDSGTYATHAVQVEVDPETGLVKVLKYFAAHDVGFAIHPANVLGQIEGGVASGIGYALSEELILRCGEVRNPNLLDYKLPTIMNIPTIESAIVEVPARFGPYGAKGVGEPTTIPVAPAIANAIYDAVGVRITDLPMTPERIFNALQRK